MKRFYISTKLIILRNPFCMLGKDYHHYY